MQSRSALLGTLLLSGAIIALSPRLALSPGPLTSGHAEIAGDCLRCHAMLRGASAAKCIGCHPLDSIGIVRRSLVQPANARPALAGMHTELQAADCLDCHTDHAGPDPTGATRGFVHENLNRSLLRRCTGCHAGNRPTDDLHRQVADECASCHSTRAWTPTSFKHDQYFPLDRDHNVGCTTCHIESAGYKQYTCYGCHEHSPTAIVAAHHEQSSSQLRDCVRCHTSIDFAHEQPGASPPRRCTECHEGNRPADDLHRQVAGECATCHTTQAWTPASFKHDQYFVLDRDHQTSCRTCHTEAAGYKQYTCYGCHEHSLPRIAAKHREEGVTSNLSDCVRCHRSADEHEGGGEGRERNGDD